MITRRTKINLAVFLGLAALLIFFGVVSLLANPFQHRTQVTAVFPDASGLHPDFSVTFDGVDVGSVSSVQLAPEGVKVDIRFDPGVDVPDDVVATVDLANALGEQQIDLRPTHGGKGRPLRDGDAVPVDPNGVPADVGHLVAVATRILDAVPADQLNGLLHETAVALAGRGQDLRTLVEAGSAFDREVLAHQDELKALLANSPPVLDAVSAVGPQLRDALSNTAVLAEVLAQRRQDLAGLLDNGAVAGADLNTLVGSQLPNLACLTHDFGQLTVNLAQPTNLGNLNTALQTNQSFFGPVDSVAASGTAVSLYPGDPTHSQFWLRTRLLLPPAQPPADAYATLPGLPPTKPGAACDTEFGPGAGAATQAHPAAPGPGGKVVPPSPSDAQVRGGQLTARPASYRVRPPATGGQAGWMGVLAGALVVAAGVVLGTRAPRHRRPVER